MNTKIPRSFAVGCSLAVIFLVFIGITLTQSSSADTGNQKVDLETTTTPGNNGVNMPPGQMNRTSDITTTITLAHWRNMRPTENYLHSVSMLPSTYDVDCASPAEKSKGWAVGDNGVILYYCNGIWDHAITVESTPTNLYSVQAISPTLGVAAGVNGAILHYLYDRIALDWVWTKSPLPVGSQALYSISMVPDGNGNFTGWAVGVADETLRGTLVRGTISPSGLVDGHQTYSYSYENVTSEFSDPSFPEVDSYYGVQLLSPTNGWAVGGKEGVRGLILHWDGTDWSVILETPNFPFYGLHMNSATDGWAVGNGGVIYHYNGTAWSPVDSPTEKILTDVDFAPDGEGWIVGYDGTLLKYLNGTWTVFTDLRTDRFDFRGIDFTSGHGWIVGLHFSKGIGGQILEYYDDLWLSVTPPTDNRLNEVFVVNDNDAWAVGVADDMGGTIIHWDGIHWQRWFQKELPIPPQDLYTVHMVSANDGWAGGETPSTGGPAMILHWDGYRWTPPRYDAPVNVAVNDLTMLDHDFGWAVADYGNGVAKYDGYSGYWSANHTCYDNYYRLRSGDIIEDIAPTPPAPAPTPAFNWDAWAVGSWHEINTGARIGERFLRYESGCATSYAWKNYAYPWAPPPPTPTPPPPPEPTQTPIPKVNGEVGTCLYGIDMVPGPEGYATGAYGGYPVTENCCDCGYCENTNPSGIPIAVVHYYDGNTWEVDYQQPPGYINYNPTAFCSASVVKDTNVAWFGGFYSYLGWRYAYLEYKDANGYIWAGDPLPNNGRGIYHRPIKSIVMASDTMGWAVGDPESEITNKLSVIYQYPFPNFTLSGEPTGRAVLPGGSTTYTVTINSPLGGFNANVSLNMWTSTPASTYNITPASITPDMAATVNIATAPSTPLGVYLLYINGSAHYRSGDIWFDAKRRTELILTVTNNPIYSVNPTHGPAGTLVTINGTGFGSSQGANDYVVLAGQQMPSSAIVSWSNAQIVVRVPDDTTLFPHGPVVGYVKVRANGSDSNTDLNFQLESRITDLAYQTVGDEIRITLTGTSLGKDPGGFSRSTYLEHVTLNDAWIPNADVTSWSNNSIVFVVPVGSASGWVSVTSNGYESNSLFFGPGNKVLLPITRR
jgi:photosystem II stability/assembly factor-like uncharacterized protein